MSSNYFATPYQEFIHLSRYSRWLPEKNRRETWVETVARYFDFFEEHLRDNNKFTFTKEMRNELEEAVLSLKVMPSMRCLMTAGEALKRENVAGYNCSYVAVDNPRSFDEILYILMNGTGVGFSVEQKYTDQLPIVSDEFHESDTTIVVADSKLGWAKALKELIQLLYSGQVPKWDVSKVRPAGAPLKTFGGRASGPDPLVSLFKFCVNTFKKAAGRRLTTLECHDIVCKIAEIVVVGGVRRSALISLSDLSDDRMRVAKSGEWWKDNVQRALANNSFVAREKIDVGIFMKEWLSLYESKSGERGIFSRTASQKQAERFGRRDSNHEFGTNPCSEIILRSREFCNLTEVVVRETDNEETLAQKVRLATILGTIQSTLTNFKYISKKWKENCEEERLLGVSLTGILDNNLLNMSGGEVYKFELEKLLNTLRDIAVETNKEWAGKIGIPQSAAVTCVKPSGCTTLETEIMTEHGKMSMAEIFAEYSDVNIFECNPGTWLELNKPLRVMDENYELQNVTKLYVNGINEVYEIEDDSGNLYKFTGNHKLKTINGWKRVDELTENDEIIQFGNS
jgi:ribonucleoside-diphosphate reductase alpha chain